MGKRVGEAWVEGLRSAARAGEAHRVAQELYHLQVDGVKPGTRPSRVVLAIDPGSAQSAWIVYNPDTDGIRSFALTPNEDLRRMLRAARIPTVLLLATLGLTVKTLVGVLSGSTFAYFLQPVATTVVIAGVLLGSLLIGRPLVARFAHDFCPVAPDVARRPAVVRLFIGLTVLWAGAQLLTAAITFGMLVTLSVPMFVALKTVVYAGISITAIVITVSCALRTARKEQLTFAAP